MNEQEMRAANVPWPKTIEELTAYITMLVDRPHDYGTCVYAMSMAAVAAFYYVSHKLGVTGFQASCADLDIIRRTRGMKGPFIILDAENLLYPQYDLRQKLEEWLTSSDMRKWLNEEAKKKIAKSSNVHPDVMARWKELAS